MGAQAGLLARKHQRTGLLLYLEVTPYDTLLHLDNAFSVPHSASLVTPDF